jgi:hypothetical protein
MKWPELSDSQCKSSLIIAYASLQFNFLFTNFNCLAIQVFLTTVLMPTPKGVQYYAVDSERLRLCIPQLVLFHLALCFSGTN